MARRKARSRKRARRNEASPRGVGVRRIAGIGPEMSVTGATSAEPIASVGAYPDGVSANADWDGRLCAAVVIAKIF